MPKKSKYKKRIKSDKTPIIVSEKHQSPDKGKSRISVHNMVTFMTFLLAVIIFMVARYHFTELPLNRDEGAYGYLGKVAMSGGIVYSDFYEMKPPGLYYIFGLFGSIFGYGEVGLRVAVAVVNMGIASFLFLFSRNIFKDQRIAIISTSFFLVLSLNQGTFGFSAVAEHYVLLFSMASLYFISKGIETKYLIIAGVMMAIAMTIKQSALFFFLFALLYIFLESRQNNSKSIFRSIGAYLLPIAIIGFSTLLLIYFLGDWDGFKYWVFKHASSYSGASDKSDTFTYLWFFTKKYIAPQWPLFIFSALGLLLVIYHLIKGQRKLPVLLLSLLFFSFLSLFPGLRFYPQYWIFLSPVMALFIGFLFRYLYIKNKIAFSIISILGLVALGLNFWLENNYYLAKQKNLIMTESFTGNPYYEVSQLSKYLNKIKQPNEKLMVLGSEPQAYLYFGGVAPTKHIYPSMITKQTEVAIRYQKEAYQDLVQSKPEYVLFSFVPFSWGFQAGENRYLYIQSYSYVTNNYYPIGYADFVVGRSTYVVGAEAANYNPRHKSYLALYKKR